MKDTSKQETSEKAEAAVTECCPCKTAEATGSFLAVPLQTQTLSLCTLWREPTPHQPRTPLSWLTGEPFHSHSSTAWHKPPAPTRPQVFPLSPQTRSCARRNEASHGTAAPAPHAGGRGGPRGAAQSQTHLLVLHQDIRQRPPEPHRLPGRRADELIPSQHGHGPPPAERWSRVSTRGPHPDHPTALRSPARPGATGRHPLFSADGQESPPASQAASQPLEAPPHSRLTLTAAAAHPVTGAGASARLAPRVPPALATTCRSRAERARYLPEAGSTLPFKP